MDEKSNGHKRPFGPHGEGCTCDPEEPSVEGPGVSVPPSRRGIDITTPFVSDNEHETLFSAISAAFAQHFLSAIDSCAYAGVPLNGKQIQHMLAGLLRQFALSKEIGSIVTEYAEEERSAKEAPQEEEEAKLNPLSDIHELLSRPPDSDGSG